MDIHIDNLIIGASFWGIGYATSAEGDTIILERGIHVGSEYIDCYKFGTDWYDQYKTGEADLLKSECERRSIISKKHKPILQACMPVLCDTIIKNHINVWLSTEVLKIDETSDGYLVLVSNASGMICIEADKVIDTTSGCRLHRGIPDKVISKSINAMLHTGNYPQIEYVREKEVEVYTGERPDIVYLKVFINPEDDWIVARRKLYNFWMDRPSKLMNYMLVTIGSKFEYYYSEENSSELSCIQWNPSSNYKNPIHSFDMGVLQGKGGDLCDFMQ